MNSAPHNIKPNSGADVISTPLTPVAIRTYLWDLLETTEETMRDSLAPDKMNLAEFGNMVPHLHWHVIARWKDDGWYPECPWGTKQREVNAEIIKMRRKSAEAMLPKLATALAAISEPQ